MSEYGLAAAVIALCTGLCLPLFPFLALTDLVMVYLVGALLAAVRGKRGPAAFAALLSVLCFDFFFVAPRFTLAVWGPEGSATHESLRILVHQTRHRIERDPVRPRHLKTEPAIGCRLEDSED